MQNSTNLKPVRALIVFTEALLVSWALMYLSEYFGWHLVRELGGGTVSAIGLPETQSPRR